jgi:hypothetical protein
MSGIVNRMNQPSQSLVTFDAECSKLRKALQTHNGWILALTAHPDFFGGHPPARDVAEMRANVMLAYRHVEDAIMRLGKAIQAYDGGKSVYEEKDNARIASGEGTAEKDSQ